mmetsp:Transcript_27444/g.68899  ORF Transcript_27444/g.68899 Transcript_27444/m.68899 type:complete len:143 (+) Transcript_27444:377-805(+)
MAKNIWAAYVFLLLSGFFGGHRFYLGLRLTGTVMFISAVLCVPRMSFSSLGSNNWQAAIDDGTFRPEDLGIEALNFYDYLAVFLLGWCLVDAVRMPQMIVAEERREDAANLGPWELSEAERRRLREVGPRERDWEGVERDMD